MNKRFKQLAEQAGALEVKTVLNTPAALSLNGDEIAKFAELIVRDCAEICLEANDHDNILRYFGVEE